jgi:hypothetical protein
LENCSNRRVSHTAVLAVLVFRHRAKQGTRTARDESGQWCVGLGFPKSRGSVDANRLAKDYPERLSSIKLVLFEGTWEAWVRYENRIPDLEQRLSRLGGFQRLLKHLIEVGPAGADLDAAGHVGIVATKKSFGQRGSAACREETDGVPLAGLSDAANDII